MEITYDVAKNAQNIAQGRPSFDAVARFDFEAACIVPDARKDYGVDADLKLTRRADAKLTRGEDGHGRWPSVDNSTVCWVR